MGIAIAAAALAVYSILEAVTPTGSSGSGSSAAGAPDEDEYLTQLRPHLAIAGWTDLQLLNSGREVCESMAEHDGDIRPFFPELDSKAAEAGYNNPTDYPRSQNDWVFIVDKATKWLCPERANDYLEQHSAGSVDDGLIWRNPSL